LQTKINTLLAIPGEIGFTVRMGLFTGLREEELYYIHNKEICNNELGCKCNNLHLINIENSGITIIGINWIRGNKKVFVTILPTNIWEQFRKLAKFDRHDIVAARSITKREADILYMGLRKIHYMSCVLRRLCQLMKLTHWPVEQKLYQHSTMCYMI
jgi:intergrase/recombinase